MKKLQLLFVFFILSGINKLFCQDTVYFNGMRGMVDKVCEAFKQNHPNLAFFKYHLVSTDGNIYDWYKGKNDGKDSLNFILSYLNAVNDLELSNFNAQDSSVRLSKLQKNMIKTLQNGLTPLSISFVEYEDFKDSTIMLNLIGWQNNQFTETQVYNYYPFKKKKFFMGCALNHVIKMPQFNFYMDESLIQSNIRNQIDSIYIDFGDSLGYRNLELNNSIQVSYPYPGLKNCTFKIKSGADYYYSTFQIYDSTQVNTQNKLTNSSTASCNTPVKPPDSGVINISTVVGSNLIKGRYAIWYSNCNLAKTIRKPFIISAGFNPGNGKQLVPFAIYPNDITVNVNGTSIFIPVTYGWRGTYYEAYNGAYNKRFSPTEAAQCGEGSSNHTQLLDRLRDEGYDIIILMFDNGSDYAQNNAALIEELIKTVNIQKAANGYAFENVVCGYSMGAISSRFALANMEAKYKAGLGPHPHTKMWVSFEGENQGANVPLGLQYFIDFQANPNYALPGFFSYLNGVQMAADWASRMAATVAQSFNQNPGAYELTAYTPLSPSGPAAQRINLLNAFNNIAGSFNGYPTFNRRIGISQGSAINSTVPHTTDYIIDTQLKFNPLGDSYTDVDLCDNSYTVYRPVSQKKMTARWWSSNNNQNIFDAYVNINANWTYAQRVCIKGTIGICPICTHYCYCMGPFVWAGQNIVIGQQHIAKPTVTTNYDDAPASTLSAQNEFYNGSAYPFYNNWFAGNSFASHDPKLHSFSPSISTLDLRNPSSSQPYSYFTRLDNASGGLNLLNINKNTVNVLTEHPSKRFGFPYLSYPSNHYQVTPFDAVYAIGINNGTYSDGITPKPDNQMHNEDPQEFIGDYLARVEVAPTDLFLSSQTVGASASTYGGYTGGYTAEFEARSKIIAGSTDNSGSNIYSLYGNLNFLTPNSDFKVAVGSKAILHSGDFVELLPGVEIPVGAELDAYIQPYNCDNLLFRVNNGAGKGENSGNGSNLPDLGFNYEEPINKTAGKKINSFLLYPNPNSGAFTYVNVCDKEELTSTLLICNISGCVVYSSLIYNNTPIDLNLSQLGTGIYFVKVMNKNSSDNFKLNIVK